MKWKEMTEDKAKMLAKYPRDSAYIGAMGEAAFSILFNRSIDCDFYPFGDNGDFYMGKDCWPIDVKTTTGRTFPPCNAYRDSIYVYFQVPPSLESHIWFRGFCIGIGTISYDLGNGGDGWVRTIFNEPVRYCSSYCPPKDYDGGGGRWVRVKNNFKPEDEFTQWVPGTGLQTKLSELRHLIQVIEGCNIEF